LQDFACEIRLYSGQSAMRLAKNLNELNSKMRRATRRGRGHPRQTARRLPPIPSSSHEELLLISGRLDSLMGVVVDLGQEVRDSSQGLRQEMRDLSRAMRSLGLGVQSLGLGVQSLSLEVRRSHLRSDDSRDSVV